MGKAARAVAALLHLGAVGVVDHIFKVDTRRGRGAYRQYLVGADAEMAVSQKPVLGRGQAKPGLGLVEHHEVVAGALHFGKRNVHE